MSASGSAAVVLLGMVFAVFLLVAPAAACVVQLRAAWARIAVRVAGNWIAPAVAVIGLGATSRSARRGGQEIELAPGACGRFISMLRLYWPKQTPPSIIDGTRKSSGGGPGDVVQGGEDVRAPS